MGPGWPRHKEVYESVLDRFVTLRLLLTRREGQGLVEYALILVLVAVVVIAVLATIGNTIEAKFQQIVTGLNSP